MNILIKPATPDDVPQILAFIRGLAEYEKLAHQYIAMKELLRSTLFGERAYVEVIIEGGGRRAGRIPSVT